MITRQIIDKTFDVKFSNYSPPHKYIFIPLSNIK